MELFLSSFLLLLLSAYEEPSDRLFLGVGSKKEFLMPSDLAGMERVSPPQKEQKKRRVKGAVRLAGFFPIAMQNSTSAQKSHAAL